EGDGDELAPHEERGALEALHEGHAAHEALLPRREGEVVARDDPRRRALIEVQPADARLDLRHELDRRGARADDGDAAAVEREVVVPARRVEQAAGEAIEPRQARIRRLGEGADGADEHVGGEAAARGVEDPDARALVPRGGAELVSEAQVGQHAEALGAAPEVGVDLGGGRVGAAPVGVGGEAEGIEVRLHVAGAARVGVVAPDAADVVGALEDEEVLDARLPQADGEAKAAEAAAGDGNVDVAGVGLRSHRVLPRCSLLTGAGTDQHHTGTNGYQCGTIRYQMQAQTRNLLSSPRLQLIEGLCAAVEARGLAATRIADIVRHARVSKRTFYEHFADKEACFVEAYREMARQTMEEIA